jgi:hypothetical protein
MAEVLTGVLVMALVATVAAVLAESVTSSPTVVASSG